MLDSRRTHSTEQTQSTSHEFAKGSQVKAKGVLLIQSGADMHIDASQLQGDQGVALLSAGQLAITGQTLQGSGQSQETVKESSFKRKDISTSQSTQSFAGSTITSGAGNVSIKALGDLSAQSLQLSAGGDATLAAGGALAITSAQTYSSTQTGSDVRQSLQTQRSQIEAGGDITMLGDQSVTLSATDVSSGGKALVQSKGEVELGYNTDTDQHNWTTSSTSRSWGGLKKKTTTTQHETVDKTAEVTQIDGAQVQVLGNNVSSYGAHITGQELVQIEGADKTALYAVNEEYKVKADSQTKSSFLGMTYSKSTSSDSSFNSTALGTTLTSQEAIKVGVGATTDVRGAILSAPKVDFYRNQNADASKPGELILGASTNTSETSHTEKTTTAGVWQKQSGQGGTTETANPTQINGQLNIGAGINTAVQIPEGQLKDQIEALSQQPGMGYLKELASKPGINWEQIKLANEQWSYSQQGLTPAGAALLSIAVAVYTGGMGAELLGGTAGTAATATTAATQATLMGSTALGAAANAGFAALTSSAAVSFVNNGGDIGKTLKELGSKDSVKNIALAMVSAGALNALGSSLQIDGKNLNDIKVADGFGANLGKAVVNNMASAAMTSALTGTSLEDNLKTGLVSAFISAGAGQSANAIGDVTKDSQALKALAHALAGCMAGGASGGKQGCESGAVGAVVGELAAQWINPTDEPTKMAKTLELVKVISAAAGALTGDGSAASVSTAVMTGVNAALNNRMLHPTEANLIKNNAQRYAQERFGTSTPSAQQIEAAQAELANTAQSMLDNNLGVVVPYVGQAADFLAKLKVEYMQQYGSLNLPGTAGAAGGTQQLFYATVEQKNMPWLNQGLADPKVTGLIVRTPINPPKTADTIANNRDRLTGLPLDDKGRYEVSVTLGDKNYSPKFYPCATAECVKSGGNLDMGDAGTQAYVKALDKKVMDDINTAATVGTIVAPMGVAGTLAGLMGPATSIVSGLLEDKAWSAIFKEGTQIAAEEYLKGVYKFPAELAKRFVAGIDLAGGWQAFVGRIVDEAER